MTCHLVSCQETHPLMIFSGEKKLQYVSVDQGVAGSCLARICDLALRRCASKIWDPCRDLDGM